MSPRRAPGRYPAPEPVPFDASNPALLAALERHPLPAAAIRGMHADGRITARLRDELLRHVGAGGDRDGLDLPA